MDGGDLLAARLGIGELVVAQVELADLREYAHKYERLLYVLRVAVSDRQLVVLHKHGDRLAHRLVEQIRVLQVEERRALERRPRVRVVVGRRLARLRHVVLVGAREHARLQYGHGRLGAVDAVAGCRGARAQLLLEYEDQLEQGAQTHVEAEQDLLDFNLRVQQSFICCCCYVLLIVGKLKHLSTR